MLRPLLCSRGDRMSPCSSTAPRPPPPPPFVVLPVPSISLASRSSLPPLPCRIEV